MFSKPKKILSEERLEYVANEFSNKFILHSVNSAKAIFLLLYFVQYKYNDVPYSSIIQFIYRNLSDDDFMCSIKDRNIIIDCSYRKYIFSNEDVYELEPLEKYIFQMPISEIAEPKLQLLTVKFYYYYFKILPFLLKGVTEYNAMLSNEELLYITNKCLDSINKSDLLIRFAFIFDENIVYHVKKDFFTSIKIKKEKDKLDIIKDYGWIFRGYTDEKKLLPKINKNVENSTLLFDTIMKDGFIMFYKAIQNYYCDYCLESSKIKMMVKNNNHVVKE